MFVTVTVIRLYTMKKLNLIIADDEINLQLRKKYPLNKVESFYLMADIIMSEQPNHNLRCIVNYDLVDLSLVTPGVRI